MSKEAKCEHPYDKIVTEERDGVPTYRRVCASCDAETDWHWILVMAEDDEYQE